MNTSKDTAKAIRQELKQAFPSIKFSVRKRHYDCIDISWIDGPLGRDVDRLIAKHVMGSFDGMTDCYDYSNRRDDIPQVQYIFTKREVSEGLAAAQWEKVKEYYGLEGNPQDWFPKFRMYGSEIVFKATEGRL